MSIVTAAAGLGMVMSTTVATTPAARAEIVPPVGTPATVSADSLPTAQINGVVWAQVVVGDTVYATGQFTAARPAGAAAGTNETPRSNLVAYDIRTGVLNQTWAPALNGTGLAITASPDGRRIYVAGEFTTVNGVRRNRLAAVDATSGAVVNSFAPNLNTRARAVAVLGGTVYAGGSFSTANGAARSRLAAWDAATGTLLPWAPQANAEVMALVAPPGSGQVVAGGRFTTLNGEEQVGMGALDAATGTTREWAANRTIRNFGSMAAIWSLSTDGTNVYGTGYSYLVGNDPALSDGNLESTFAARTAGGELVWVSGCRGDTYGSYPIGDVLYSVTHAHGCAPIGGNPDIAPDTYQYALATSTARGPDDAVNHGGDFDGQPAPQLLHWLPTLTAGSYTGQRQAAWTVGGNADYVLLAGEFPTVNGTPQQGLARFATGSRAPKAEGPQGVSAPTLVAGGTGEVKISWRSAWDRDDPRLTYEVLRGTTVSTATRIGASTAQPSTWWSRPATKVTDTGAAPGSSQTYRLRVTDGQGNSVTSATAKITVPASDRVSPYVKAVTGDGATHLWRLNETSGPSVDQVGGENLTIAGSATRGTAGALSTETGTTSTTFPGTAVAPAVPNASPVAAPERFAVEAWIRTTSSAGGKIIGYGDSATVLSDHYDRQLVMTGDGRIAFGVNGNGLHAPTSAAAYNDGAWHHVVGSLGDDGARLFVDGALVAEDPDADGGEDFHGFWRVAGDNWSGWPDHADHNGFEGSIQDVAVYAGPLTAQQVSTHHAVGGGRPAAAPARPSDAYGAAVYDDGPRLFWRLDEPAGAGPTAAADAVSGVPTGRYTAGILRGEPGSPANPGGAAARLAGGGKMSVIATAADRNPVVYSLETWFRTSTGRGGRLIGFGNRPSGDSDRYDRFVYLRNDGRLQYAVFANDLALVTSPDAYNDGQWHHLVATQGEGGMRLYVDGQQVGENGSAVTPEETTGYWRLGYDNTWAGIFGDADSNDLDGWLDEAAVYDRELSPERVAEHHRLGTGG